MSDSERRRKQDLVKGTFERRVFASPDLELRDAADGDGWTLYGHAAVFDTEYEMGDDWSEVVSRSAFTRTLSEQPDVVLNCNHGRALSGLPLARTKSRKGGPGSLVLATDARGLTVHARLDPHDQDAQILRAKINAGAVSSMSMAFKATSDRWDGNVRHLDSIALNGGDVSVVTDPASPMTSVSMRAAQHAAAVRASRMQVPNRTAEQRMRLARYGWTPATAAYAARAPAPGAATERARLARLHAEIRDGDTRRVSR